MRLIALRLAAGECGATSIEYALIGSLLSIAIVLGATALGTKLNDVFEYITDLIPLAN